MYRVTLQTQNKVHTYGRVEIHPIFAEYEGDLSSCLARVKLWRKRAPKSRIFLQFVSRIELTDNEASLLAHVTGFNPVYNVEHLTSIAELRHPSLRDLHEV